MPNIAAVLKDEIRRLARREVKTHAVAARRAAAHHRRDIAQLKRLVDQQEKELKGLKKELQQQRAEQPSVDEEPLEGVRYSARSVKAQRQRLGLSAVNYGKLVGVAPLTIYNWEHGKARPRPAQLAAFVAIRGIGKREALKELAELKEQTTKKRRAGKQRGGR